MTYKKNDRVRLLTGRGDYVIVGRIPGWGGASDYVLAPTDKDDDICLTYSEADLTEGLEKGWMEKVKN